MIEAGQAADSVAVRSGRARGRDTALAPGSCGELVQGWEDGRLLQVTCPVDRYARAEVRLHGAAEGVTAPPGYAKAGVAAARTLQALRPNGPPGASLRLRSSLPRGKGWGSSTADVTAATAATAAALGVSLRPDFVADVAVGVEPSDGTMLPGVAVFDHRRGRVRELLGSPPPLRILVLDPGGTVRTTAFNARIDGVRRGARGARHIPGRGRPSRRALERWHSAFRWVRKGLRSGDLEALGRAATASALAHEELLPNPLLPRVVGLARDLGAVGVNRAHSGTVVGLLFPPGMGTVDEVRERARHAGLPVRRVEACALIAGGVRARGSVARVLDRSAV